MGAKIKDNCTSLLGNNMDLNRLILAACIGMAVGIGTGWYVTDRSWAKFHLEQLRQLARDYESQLDTAEMAWTKYAPRAPFREAFPRRIPRFSPETEAKESPEKK